MLGHSQPLIIFVLAKLKMFLDDPNVMLIEFQYWNCWFGLLILLSRKVGKDIFLFKVLIETFVYLTLKNSKKTGRKIKTLKPLY